MQVGGYDTEAQGRGGRSSKASRETFKAKVQPTLRDRQAQVYELILRAGQKGITPKEAAKALGVGDNVTSGRFSELRDELKLIRRTGERRDDSAVYVPVFANEVGQVSLFGEAA